MKIQILSDLHTEFGDWAPQANDADVVVLAGDIQVKGRAVTWALRNFTKPVVLVGGNHDFYSTHGSMARFLAKMRQQAQGTNVHLLQDGALVLDGVRFLGATLWTDYRLTGNEPLAQLDAQALMHDFKYIRDAQFRKIRAHQIAAAHAQSRTFLTSRLEEPFDGKTVVVTHHAPCELSIHERFRERTGHLNAAYASRLDHLMGANVDAWIHGHCHDSFDYDVYGTRVICNPRGYAPEKLNPGFQENLIIEI